MTEQIVHLDGEHGYTAKIRDCIDRVKHEFVFIGLLLHEVSAFQYYLEGGYSNVYEYAEACFGFKKSSTNNFIRVYRTFGEAMGLKERYRNYSYSQLTEMCSMNSRALACCRSDMTIQELRQFKKIHPDSCCSNPVQTSGKTEVKIALSGNAGTYSVPVWLTCKLVHYLNKDGEKTIWDVIDAGLVSLFGCKSGYEIIVNKK